MILKRGYGAVVVVVVFASSLAANLISNLVRGPGYWETHGWPIALSFSVDAFILWLVDISLARKLPRTLVDESTGERFITSMHSEFLFLRLRWWALIFAVLAILVLVSGWSPGPFKR